VKEQSEVDNLPPEQENSLREFFGGQNILVNLLTRRATPSDRCGCSLLYWNSLVASVMVLLYRCCDRMEDHIQHLNDRGCQRSYFGVVCSQALHVARRGLLPFPALFPLEEPARRLISV